jgi:hypothetical protein
LAGRAAQESRRYQSRREHPGHDRRHDVVAPGVAVPTFLILNVAASIHFRWYEPQANPL